MTAALTHPAAVGRRNWSALLVDQLRHSVVDLWRARVVMVFTVALPLVWLVVVGFLAGNDAIDEETGVRVMQFVTPMAAAMGLLYGAYPTTAISFGQAREQGLLKRVRGTPLPAWIYLAGRIGGAAAYALVSVVIMLAVGVLAYDIQIVGRTLLATAVTVLAAVLCFTALGLAVAVLARSAAVAQAASIATAVVLTFVSGLFTFGAPMPEWMTTLGDVLPLKPIADLLREQFNPFHPGSGWQTDKLAVVLAWTVGAAVVAARGFRWEPRPSSSTAQDGREVAPVHPGTADASVDADRPGSDLPTRAVSQPRSPAALAWDQALAANRSAWRDAGVLFFALAMPVGLYAFMVTLQGGADAEIGGQPFPLSFAASMAVWGTAVVAFMNLPEKVASSRDAGVLRRLRGTPLSPWQYLAGHLSVAVWLSLLITGAVLVLGVLAYGVDVGPLEVAAGLLLVVFGTLVLAACGFALAAFVPSARAVGAVGLVVLLPLSFFSDVFVADAPAWMDSVGDLFPLRHLQNALAAAFLGAGDDRLGVHVAVLALWGVGAAVVALRFFRWDSTERGEG